MKFVASPYMQYSYYTKVGQEACVKYMLTLKLYQYLVYLHKCFTCTSKNKINIFNHLKSSMY